MKGPTTTAIILRRDAYDQFMGELTYLSIEKQASQLGMPTMNLRRCLAEGPVGERALIGLLRGCAAIARRRGTQPPTFETLFTIRDFNRAATGEPAGLAA